MRRGGNRWGFSAIFVLLLIVMGLFLSKDSKAGSENTRLAHSPIVEKESRTTKETVDKVNNGRMTVHFLDVGQGLSVLMESEGHYVLYDGGGPERSSYVVAYLKKQGIELFDYLVASHYDMDHISGLVGVVKVFSANELLGPDYVGDTDIYRSFLAAVEERGGEIVHPLVGDTYHFGSATIKILAPLENYADPNECSLVMKVTCGNTSLLLTGDAANQSENDMISAETDLQADVLAVGHHGSNASTSEDFLENVNPKYVVVSCGTDNKFRHPAQGTMERLKNSNLDMYRTDLQGTVKAVFEDGSITWDQAPSGDYTGRDVDEPLQPKAADSSKEHDKAASAGYVLNTNTLKFHRLSCHSANKIAPENRSEFSGTREEAISMGYAPCGNCRP